MKIRYLSMSGECLYEYVPINAIPFIPRKTELVFISGVCWICTEVCYHIFENDITIWLEKKIDAERT